MDDQTRQALMQPAVQESLRAALAQEGAQEALRAFHQARAKLLEFVSPALEPHGLVSMAQADSNPIVAKSVEFANASGLVDASSDPLTYARVSDWLEQQYGSVPQPVSIG
jgi:hypothetical protein